MLEKGEAPHADAKHGTTAKLRARPTAMERAVGAAKSFALGEIPLVKGDGGGE